MCDEKTVEYLRDLIAEKHELEQIESGGNRKAIVTKLLDQGRKEERVNSRTWLCQAHAATSCHLWRSQHKKASL